jgi:hypothetical protein
VGGGRVVTLFLLAGGLVVHDVKEEALVQLRIVDGNSIIVFLGGLLAALVEGRGVWRFVWGATSFYHDQVWAWGVLVEIVGLAHVGK